MSFAVIDQLEADVMKGFWSVPKRGAEVGGVLFGHIEASETETLVYVEDYEPVECEYRRGPSFVLSDIDRRRLERILRKGAPGRQVVGMYRSHTRLGLYLDQDDQGLIQNYFPGPHQVVLLVRPHASKTSVGGFFFWEEGAIHRQSTYLEFPFSRSEILKRMDSVKWRDEAEDPAPPKEVAQPEPAPQPETVPVGVLPGPVPLTTRAEQVGHAVLARVRHIGWRPAGIAALVLLCIAGIEYQVLKIFAHRAPVAAQADFTPALRIERNGEYLQVNWNRNAPSILNARRAVLEITDGGYSKELRLDPGQLRTGSVAYSPASDDVNFRLELVGAKTTVSESLRVVDGTGRPPAAEAHAPRVRPSPAISARTSAARPAKKVQAAQRAQQAPKRTAVLHRRTGWYDDGL